MSAEPFYCQRCGEIKGACRHYDDGTWLTEEGGPFCEICGEKNDEPGCEFTDHPKQEPSHAV